MRRPAEALALLALSFAALLTIGPLLSSHGASGVAAAELVCVLSPTLAFVALRRPPDLGLGRAAPLALFGGLSAGGGAFYLLAALVEPWLESRWPLPPGLQRAMRELILPSSGARPLAVDLVLLALLPALAEELLFRGVLLGALRPRFGAVAAVVLTALAFALYHASPYKLVPAALAGLLFGGVRLATASLWPAVAVHFANNAGVLIALRLGYERPPGGALPLALAGLALVGGGAAVIRGGRGCRA